MKLQNPAGVGCSVRAGDGARRVCKLQAADEDTFRNKNQLSTS